MAAEVDVRIGLSPEELREAIAGVSGLIIALCHAGRRRADRCGRAIAGGCRSPGWPRQCRHGAATANGVMVVNAPSRTSPRLRAMALCWRRPQRSAGAGAWSTAAGNSVEGVELEGKTLGVVGFGRIESPRPLAPLRSA